MFQSPGTVRVERHRYIINTSCQDERPVASAAEPPVCSSDGESATQLYARSYTVPERWPFPPIHMVMESAPRTCNLYKYPQACCALASSLSDVFIERPVREVIASFLTGCHRRPLSRPCLSVDLGANNGWMTAYMLSTGSHVIAVEPAPDLARAVKATGALNCWSQRLVVVNAFACAPVRTRIGWCPPSNGSSAAGGYRMGGTPQRSQVVRHQIWAYAAYLGKILSKRPAGWPELSQTAAETQLKPHFDLVKMDGDGPEGGWLTYLGRLVSRGNISVGTIVLEANGITPQSMRHFQADLGYTVLRLDYPGTDSRRFITSKGWDAYSPRGTYASLDRFGTLRRDVLEEELLSTRAMRHTWRIRPNLTEQQWSVELNLKGLQAKPGSALQFVLTRHSNILDPVHGGQLRRSSAWKASHYIPPDDGID